MANENARALRKRLTPQEVKLWLRLRELKALGFHFRRQAPIGRYIVDFVSFRSRLIVEADGGQHGMPDGARSGKDALGNTFARLTVPAKGGEVKVSFQVDRRERTVDLSKATGKADAGPAAAWL